MSTRVVRSLEDFVRHRMGIEVVCGCGHRAVLEAGWVLAWFREKGWSTSLAGAVWFADAYARFYCLKCFTRRRGKVRPARIGPGER